MKLIAWWIGTDALTLIKNPPADRIWYVKLFFYRLKWKLLKGFFEHWAVHENLTVYLKQFGINAKVVVYPADYPDKVEKIPHEGFNILYYRPYRPANLGGWKYLNWYYGFDIFLELLDTLGHIKDMNFIICDLRSKNIDEIYALADCYIRPNRWDGHPRMTQECQIKGIPFYWNSNIGKDGYLKSDFHDCYEFIMNEYSKWKYDNK